MAITVHGRSPIAAQRIISAVRTIRRTYPRLPADVTIVFASAAVLRNLNRRYRRHDRSTTILSFQLGTVGELYLSLADIRRTARAHGLPLDATLIHLIAHGVLHLAGFRHDTVHNRERMLRAEQRLAIKLTPSHLPFHVIH